MSLTWRIFWNVSIGIELEEQLSKANVIPNRYKRMAAQKRILPNSIQKSKHLVYVYKVWEAELGRVHCRTIHKSAESAVPLQTPAKQKSRPVL